MNNSNMFNLNWQDLARGLVVAILVGIILPILAAIQTPGFDAFHANWHEVLVLAINGGLAGFAGYITKNFFTASNGKVLGTIG